MKRLISIFDYSGIWSEPFWAAGWDVVQWDIKLDKFLNINFLKSAGSCLRRFEYCDGILAAPPCTDFTSSGAQYWSAKDANGTTAKAVQLVRQVQKLADLFTPTDPDYDETFFWSLENPVGRISKACNFGELEGSAMYFHPWEYAGYTNPTAADLAELDRIRLKDGFGVTPEECELVLKCNAYTKKTGLWGDFNRDLVKKPIAPVKCHPQGTFTQRFGGKSAKTKEERSNTPAGFAQAFFEANKEHRATINF